LKSLKSLRVKSRKITALGVSEKNNMKVLKSADMFDKYGEFLDQIKSPKQISNYNSPNTNKILKSKKSRRNSSNKIQGFKPNGGKTSQNNSKFKALSPKYGDFARRGGVTQNLGFFKSSKSRRKGEK